MHELAETLADALKVLGCKVERDVVLEGRSGRVVTAPVLAEAGARTFAVWMDEHGQEDLAAAEALRTDLGADGLVLALRDVPATEEPEGVACWPRHVVASLLGDALLAECGLTPRPIPWPTPVAPSRVEDALPPAFAPPRDQGPPQSARPFSAPPFSAPPFSAPPFSAPPFAEPPFAEPPFTAPPLSSPPFSGPPFTAPPTPPAAHGDQEASAAPEGPHAEAGFGDVSPFADAEPPAFETPAFLQEPEAPEAPPGEEHAFALDALDPASNGHDFDRHGSVQERAAAVAGLGPPLSGGALHPELWDLSIEEEPVRPRRLPVRLTPRDADSIARRQGFTVDRYLLVLQPVHLFDAEVDTLRQGRLDAWTESMRLQVHGTDRSIATVDPQRVDPSLPDLLAPAREVTIEERTVRVQPGRARELAHAWLKESYTRTVEVPAGGDLFEYTERRKVTPRDDQIRVSPLGLFHRPVWRLEGPAGALELDAMTGELVASQARSYPDTMLIE